MSVSRPGGCPVTMHDYRVPWVELKLSGVHGSLGPRRAREGAGSMCLLRCIQGPFFRDPSSFFLAPQSSVPPDRIQFCAYC